MCRHMLLCYLFLLGFLNDLCHTQDCYQCLYWLLLLCFVMTDTNTRVEILMLIYLNMLMHEPFLIFRVSAFVSIFWILICLYFIWCNLYTVKSGIFNGNGHAALSSYVNIGIAAISSFILIYNTMGYQQDHQQSQLLCWSS